MVFILYKTNVECLFVESSALTGENVDGIFSKLTQTVIYKVDQGEIPPTIIANLRSIQNAPTLLELEIDKENDEKSISNCHC